MSLVSALLGPTLYHAPVQGKIRITADPGLEIGFDPGEKADPVGDELNWEQFLSFIRASGKTRLWIVSRDPDYCCSHGNQVFLIPTLRQELMQLSDRPSDVYPFTNIPEGIKHFSEITGVRADKLPTPETIEEIKKEQEGLPPIGWMESNDAASIVIHNAQTRLGQSLFLTAVAGEGSGWHPGMLEQERGLITDSAPPSQEDGAK